MPSTAHATNGFGQPIQCTISSTDRRSDRHPSQAGRMPDVVVLLQPAGRADPAGWRASRRAIGPAGVADLTELSGAVSCSEITPSELVGVIANQLTGFARAGRGGNPTAETHVEAGFGGQAIGGAA
jgi:hypothetical protein